MNTVSGTVAAVLRGALVLGAGLGAVAHSQEAGNQLEEVQVTGTRIQRDGMSTPTPVTAVTAADLSVLSPTTLGAAMTQLPQFNNSSVPEGAPSTGWTGASGASILNLRGVGSNRTLVLLDSRRVVPSSRRGTLDVNLLPDALVQRVEVVTGGASAAYGSDAVSGVVNFILDTDYEGFQAEIQGGVTELGDNQNYNLGLAGGFPIGDSLHLIAAVDYFHADPIKDATERDWQQSWGVITNPAYNATTNPNVPARLTRENVRSRQFTQGGLILSGPFINQQFLPGGTLAPFVAGTDVSSATQVGGDGEDLAWYNYFTPDTTRGSGFAYLSWDVADNTELFLQGLFGMNDSAYLSPPAGAQFTNWAATIYGDNAYLPTQISSTMTPTQSFRLGRAGDLDYGGSKEITQENRLMSGTAGMKMKFGDDWRLDAYYQFGRTDSDIYMDKAIRLDRVYQAIDAVRNTSGQIVCRSTLMYPTNGCVPMNIFGVGSPSQQAIDWITQDISQKQIVEQSVADAAISGTPFANWAGEVAVAGGLSWRRESFRQNVYPAELHALDMPLITPALGYKGLPTVYAGTANIFERGPSVDTRGSYQVSEAFAEMQMPLLGETAMSRSVDFNGAVRYAYYEGSGGIWAWKAGLDWQVTNDLRLRATRSRDVRAGSLSERFDASRGPGNVTDPEAATTTPYAVTVIAGGNPEVDPEAADTLTFGFVYQPSWFTGFSMSVDAYDIDIADAIGQLGAQNIVDQCYAGATQLCQYVIRDSSNVISTVYNLFINTNLSTTRGVDIEASFRRGVTLFGGGAENLGFRVLASYIDELATQQQGAAEVSRVGQTGLGGGAPDWQTNASLTYGNGPFSGTLQGRYISSGTYDATWTTGVQIDNNRIPSSFVTNLQLNFDGQMSDNNSYRIWLNVSNLFDADPPLVASWGFTGSLATNSALFDVYGRRYNLGVRFNF